MRKFSLFLFCIIVGLMGYSQTIFTQNFESAWTLPPTLTPAWSGTTTPASNVWHQCGYTTGWTSSSGVYSPLGANSTTASARFHSLEAANGSTGDFISPTIDLSAYTGGTIKLEFYHINTSGADVLNVYSSDDNGATWSSALSPSPIGISAAWTLKTISLPGNSATTKIKLTATSDFGTTDIGIDEIRVYVPVTANAAPINFTATSVAQTSMTIGWTDNSTNETAFRAYRSTDNVNFTKIGNDIPSTTTAGTSTTYSQAQTGLIGGVTYYYRIAAVTDLESAYLTGSQITANSTVVGTKTIGGPGTPDYPTIAAAIADLNLQGVGYGGVVFNIPGNYTETFASATAGRITTNTGASYSPIVFQKSGTDGVNPIVTAPVGTGTMDAIITFAGTDYITFDGIDLQESAANVTTTTQMEWGYAILKASATDGSQFVTIKNCNIKLNKTNTSTVGVYANNHLATSITQLVPTAASGTNSNLKIFNNTFDNCYTGISISGYNHTTAPYDLYDQNNEIGKDGSNKIANFGGGAVASNGIYTIYQNNLKVANNNITGTIAGNATCSGIQLGSSANANLDLYNNYISLAFAGTTGSFNGIYDNMGTTATNTNVVNIYGNSVTGCILASATSSTCYYMNIAQAATTFSFHGNSVTNNTFGSATATATGTIAYIYLFGNPTTSGTSDVYSNDISGNKRIQSTLGAGTTYCLYQGNKGNTSNTYSNTITNNTFAATGTVYGIYLSNASTTKNLYNNTISGINNANGVVQCIYNGSGSALNVYNNTVTNVTSNSAASTVSGFVLNSLGATGDMIVHDNFISGLYAPNATNTVPAVTGMNLNAQSVNNMGVFNNTIYLDAVSSGANFSSTGIYAYTNAVFNDFRNNIVINKCTPTGTGITSALRYSAVGLTNYSTTSNNNNYYCGTPSPTRVIYYDGTNSDRTLAGFKQRANPRELQSVTENTNFINTSATPYNLHVNAAIPAQVESSGTVISSPVSLTQDFDGDARYPNSGYPNNVSYPAIAPDMGADEFGGIPNDMNGPIISYTFIGFTASTTAHTLTATITDPHGVPTSGIGLPRLAWKKSTSGSWSFVTSTSIGSNQYNFTFGDGVAQGDTVFYFVVAQDNFSTPAVGTYPMVGSSGYSINPPACSTYPSTLSYYYISAPLCGTYTIGTGRNYATLTAAVADYNQKEITCPVVFELMDATYTSETYPITLNHNPGSSSTNTLSIRPTAGKTVSMTGTSTDCLIKLKGAQYVNIDGSNSGGTDRSLTFINNSAAGLVCGIRYSHDGISGASNDILKNTIIQGSLSGTSATYAILMDNGAGQGGYSNITINNNTINTVRFGIIITGTAANNATNIQFTNNTLGGYTDATGIVRHALEIQSADNVLIEGNEIMGLPNGTTTNQVTAGIYDVNGTNVRILRNKIHDFNCTAVLLGANAVGIVYAVDAPSVGEISNNVVYNIKYPGTYNNPLTPGNPTGISIGNNVGVLKMYNNSVLLSGNYLSASTAGSSVCVGIGNNNTGIDFRNNILKNSSQPISGTPSTQSFAIGIGTGNTFTHFDYNDYYSDGIGPYVGFINSTAYTSVSDWQAATGWDAHSIQTDPQFTSTTNLLPTSTNMPHAGQYIPTLTTDIIDASRTNPCDMGAYEFSADPTVTTTSVSGITNSKATFTGTANANGMSLNVFFDYGTTTAYGSSIAANPSTVTGTTTTTIEVDLTSLAAGTTYHFRARGVTSGGVTAYGSDMTFTTSATAAITFNVDMSTAAGFVPGTDVVYIAGGFPGATWNQPGTNPSLMMSRVGSTLTYTLTMALVPGTYEYKYFKNAGWDGGEYAGGSNRSTTVVSNAVINDQWGGQINWANVQWPGTGTIDLGGGYDVYAQAFIGNGVTYATGVAYGLQAWIGYSTSNTDPSTWTNWVAAPYFGQSGDNDEFKANLGAAIVTPGTYYYASRFQFGNMAYIYGGFSGGSWDGTSNVSGVLTVNAPATKTLNAKVFLEGLYNAESGMLVKTQGADADGNVWDMFAGTISDTLSVAIAETNSPFNTVFEVHGVEINTDGSIVISTIPASITGDHYIIIRHRNSIETWSQAVSFTAQTISFDMTDDVAKAWGSNLKQVGSVYCIYTGDANGDQYIDGFDLALVFNQNIAGAYNYQPEDLNGDGFVDGFDLALVFNNNLSGAGMNTPINPMGLIRAIRK